MPGHELTERLRSFNRFYTRQVGLVTDRYLGQERPLAEARVLYEIGRDGTPIRDLRRRLALDSGYLSRVIRKLERADLVFTSAGAGDRRLREVHPTDRGREELAEMDRRAAVATSELFARLNPDEKGRLAAAIDTVESLLRASSCRGSDAVRLRVAGRADAAVIAALLVDGFQDQGGKFSPTAFAAVTPDVDAVAERIAQHRVWVVEWNGRIIGTATAELRPPSCWVRSLAVTPDFRGLRVADRLLAAVEKHASAKGATALELDTTPFQVAAARVYHRHGYRPVHRHDVFGTEMIRMVKPLSPTGSSS